MAITLTEEQIQYNATHIIGPPPSSPGQVGQYLPIPGRRITKLGFWLSKYRYPTGQISFSIYRGVPDTLPLGALLASQVLCDAAALPATLDPADLVTDAIYYEVTFAAPVDIDEEVCIVVDYVSTFHDGTNNLWVMIANSDVKPNECKVSRIGVWRTDPDKDCAYIYSYEVVPPTVTTQAVSDIEETTAKGPGEITDIGGEDCDKRGICWKTTPGPTVADSKSEEIGSFGTGAFTRSMTGLSPGTKYYVKAYAHNSAGYGYGSEVTFTTKPQVATGFSATAIDENQIDVSWTAGAGATKTMVRRKVGSYPTSRSDGDQAYFDIGNSFSDLGLTPGTHYFYRAWSWVEGSDIWSDAYAEDDAATPLVPPEPPPPPAALPEYQKRALVVGGGDVSAANPLPISSTPTGSIDALQSIQLEHRLGRSLNDFFNARISAAGVISRIDLDAYWTAAGLACPVGYSGLAVYSRRTFSYGSVYTRAKLPTLAANLEAWVGFEVGAGGQHPISALHLMGTKAYIFAGSAFVTKALEITSLLPANYDSWPNMVFIKLNRCSVELSINGTLKGIVLYGLTEAIPDWEDNPPYALGGCLQPAHASSLTTLLEISKNNEAITFPIDITSNSFAAADGDPAPPRQYTLYNESTATKWIGQAIAAGTITSHPVPVWGYPRKTLNFMANGAGTLLIQLYSGGGWRTAQTVPIAANTLNVQVIDLETPIIRCQFTPTAYPTTVTLAEVLVS